MKKSSLFLSLVFSSACALALFTHSTGAWQTTVFPGSTKAVAIVADATGISRTDSPQRNDLSAPLARRLEPSDGTAFSPIIAPLTTTQVKLTAGDGLSGDNFGHGVAISGDTAVVRSNGSVYVFVWNGALWTQQQKLPGGRLAVIDSNTIAVANHGSISVFVREGSAWAQQQIISTSGFAYSLALSGNTIVLGDAFDSEGCPAGNCGAAYVFVRNGTTWTQQQKIFSGDHPPFAPSSAAAVIIANPGESFGAAVAVSGDTIVVGAPDAGSTVGAAYVFVRSGSTWTQQQKLTVDIGNFSAYFGSAVAISRDTVVVGAFGAGGTIPPGYAYVFTRGGITWALQQRLSASDGEPSDLFGQSVAISNGTIVVGNYPEDTGDPNVPPRKTGSAYVFHYGGSGWTQQQQLRASDGVPGDFFGSAVAVSNVAMLVGAFRDDTPAGVDAGSAYVFQDGEIDTTPPTLILPSTINVQAGSSGGAVVSYSVSAVDDRDPNPAVTCAPSSGSLFPVGATLVNCTATDASNNSTSDSFAVKVAEAPPPPPPQCTPAPDPVPLPLSALPNGGLRRAIVMGQSKDSSGYGHLLFQPSLEAQANNRDAKPNIDIVAESNSTWVRLWADWPTYQPSDPFVSPTDPFPNIVDLEDTCSAHYVERDPRTSALIQNLDEQIVLARSRGLHVIVTSQHFPVWATYPKSLFSPDQLSVVPKDVGVDSPWGKWIKFLVKRYGYSEATSNTGRYVDFLEVTNEPNLTILPQLGLPEKVAQMFQTAQAVVRTYGNTLRLAGPGTADIDHSKCQADKHVSDKGTNYAEFTENLLKSLRQVGFVADEYFAWSHHNYRDVECDRDGVVRRKLVKKDLPDANSAAWVRWMIVAGDPRYRWTGWPNASSPQLLITEGGARLDGILNKYPDLKDKNCKKGSSFKGAGCQRQIRNQQEKQRSLVERNFLRMAGLRGDRRLGEGIAMVSSYLTYTDPTYDSGLFDYIGPCAPTPTYSGQNWRDEFLTRSRKRPPSRCTGEWGRKRLVYDKWKSLRSGP
jgi:hypothetical protein